MDVEQRVRLMIGDLMVNNTSLMARIEESQKEIADKDKEIADLKAKKAEKPHAGLRRTR